MVVLKSKSSTSHFAVTSNVTPRCTVSLPTHPITPVLLIVLTFPRPSSSASLSATPHKPLLFLALSLFLFLYLSVAFLLTVRILSQRLLSSSLSILFDLDLLPLFYLSLLLLFFQPL